MRIALIAGLALVLIAIAPAAAPAEEGVYVDPGSPAGKEYALPLEQARREAAGRTGSAPGSSAPRTGRSALFGEGIEPRGSKGAGNVDESSGGRPGSRKASKPADAARLAAPATTAKSTTVTDISIVLAVLLAAGGLGLLLRRVLR